MIGRKNISCLYGRVFHRNVFTLLYFWSIVLATVQHVNGSKGDARNDEETDERGCNLQERTLVPCFIILAMLLRVIKSLPFGINLLVGQLLVSTFCLDGATGF